MNNEGKISRMEEKDNKLCYTIPEAARLLGFSRNFTYELARSREIPIVRFGKRIRVPKAELDRMLRIIEEEKADK